MQEQGGPAAVNLRLRLGDFCIAEHDYTVAKNQVHCNTLAGIL